MLLKLAQAGLPLIEYVSASPSRSCADGLKSYATPAVTLVGGEPLRTGARFAAITSIENGPSVAWAMPSVTVIEMFEYVPARADVGVPDKRPFAAAEGRPSRFVGDAERERLAIRIGRRRLERVSRVGGDAALADCR